MVVTAFRQMDPAARAQLEEFNPRIRDLLDEATRDTVAETDPTASSVPPPAKGASSTRK
jgi:hypothetical protein